MIFPWSRVFRYINILREHKIYFAIIILIKKKVFFFVLSWIFYAFVFWSSNLKLFMLDLCSRVCWCWSKICHILLIKLIVKGSTWFFKNFKFSVFCEIFVREIIYFFNWFLKIYKIDPFYNNSYYQYITRAQNIFCYIILIKKKVFFLCFREFFMLSCFGLQILNFLCLIYALVF